MRSAIIDAACESGAPINAAVFVGSMPPQAVKRQFTMMDTIGEEMGAAVKGQKPVDEAIKEAERRVNDMLARAN